jgi:DNA primase
MASIEEAKNIIKDTPISSIINFYHPISKKGADYKGVCPFHNDTKPSMSISDSKGVYKCFACGAAGDGIKFVQDLRNLDFIEAVKDIAAQLSIPIDEFKKKDKNPKFEMGFRVLNGAFKLYKKIATEVKPKTFTDFLKNRGLNDDSVKNFGLGFAPGNNALSSYLNSIPNAKDKDVAMKLAKEIGIIGDSKHGNGTYDFFRDRVVFPVHDHGGQVRGFQARAVLPDQKPKYMNSRESFIFDKGNILYGFNIAKNNIRSKDAVIVCEGNMDVVVLHQFGFTNSVGTMGVAFSENSSRLLGNLTKNFYLAMDSDAAGMKGMVRINEMLLNQGILPKYIDFSPSNDPDEFLNEFGRLELIARMDKAPTFLEVQIEEAIPKPVPGTTDKKLAALHKVFEIVSPLKDGLVAKEKVILASKSLGLQSSNDDIVGAYKNFLEEKEANKSKYKKRSVDRPKKAVTVQNDSINDGPPIEDYNGPPMDIDESFVGEFLDSSEPLANEQQVIPPNRVELQILSTMITNPECLESKQIAEILDLIDHNDVKQLIHWLKNIYLEIDDADYTNFIKAKLEENINSDCKNTIASALYNYNSLKFDKKIIDKTMIDLRFKLKREALKGKKAKLVQKQSQAITEEEGLKVLGDIQKVNEELDNLKK